jgi:hypothetical protein
MRPHWYLLSSAKAELEHEGKPARSRRRRIVAEVFFGLLAADRLSI